jgi:hypothetical protein
VGGVRRAWPLWVALGTHAAAAGALWSLRPPAPTQSAVVADTAIILDDEWLPQPERPSTPETFDQRRDPTPGALAEGIVPVRVTPPMPSPLASASEASETPAASASAWSFSPTGGPMDLGIGSYWKTVATASSAPRPAPSAEESAKNGDFARRLSDDMRAHDVATGHSIAGPLVSAAHDAASPNIAPDVGSVTIEIESDAAGQVVAAHVVDASGDRARWDDVAEQVRRFMANKRLRVPAGAHGVRAHVRIVAERTLPSGERTSIHAGAAPDEVCDDSGPTRRCGAGMPAGAGGTWGDVSNFGAKRSRVVHVQLLDEALL